MLSACVLSLLASLEFGILTMVLFVQCLICLEDYADDDDLRLLGCRHIFHKNCVDTWLETGRNNCPACRAQGVQRAADEPVSAV